MKQVFIHKVKGNRKLLLFFSGWASNEYLFKDDPVAEGYDCLLCYDYRDLTFDSQLLEGYSSIRLLAWSMGVWAASCVLNDLDLPWEKKIAINGTRTPVHDSMGIPVEIYHGTIYYLTDVTLRKFFRRMCGSSEQFKLFLPRTTTPVIEDLKEELNIIEEKSDKQPESSLQWDKVIIGEHDRIFPSINQREAWKDKTIIEELPIAHYDRQLFADCLSGKEEIWTRF